MYNEKELIEKAKKGDQESFAEIVREYNVLVKNSSVNSFWLGQNLKICSKKALSLFAMRFLRLMKQKRLRSRLMPHFV